jgi:Domain of unknown function (DUF222)/HNH endonuclease
MCVPGQLPAVPSGAVEALALARACLGLVAQADAASLPTETQADLLRGLEQAESAHTAARARVLGAFSAQQGFEDDGAGSAGSWLRWQARITRGAASGAVGWMRRLAAHPAVAEALAAQEISPSWAREICAWTDRLPVGARADADQILLAAGAGGADLAGLAGLAEEMFRRTAPPDPDDDDRAFADRGLQLDLHYQGAGKLTADLTPECAAAVTAVLESLGKKAGPEDDRTRPQREHDALEEACRRLIASGCLPDVAGQPVQVQLHVTLDQLRRLPGADGAEAAWAAGLAGASGEPGWVRDRKAAEAYACDAQLAPVVTGHLDLAALAALTTAWLSGQPGPAPGQPCPDGTACHHGMHDQTGWRRATPLPPRTLRRLQDTLARYAADVLSGPAGLAAFLRTGLLATEFPPAVSLPLDVGAAVSTVPPHLRRAVITRDRHCAFPGCRQRPPACHVHHLIPRATGGATALHNLTLLCPFHHGSAVKCEGVSWLAGGVVVRAAASVVMAAMAAGVLVVMVARMVTWWSLAW